MTEPKTLETTVEDETSEIVGTEAKAVGGFVPPREPKYEWGIAVKAMTDLLNDGSHPESPEGSLLILKDAVGEIVRVGYAPEANNLPVYLVEFPGGKLVGCLEEEIAPVLGGRSAAPGRM
jgi:nitrogen fixation protein NifZ